MIRIKTYQDIELVINLQKDVIQKVTNEYHQTKYQKISYITFMFKTIFDINKHIQLGDLFYETVEKRN